MSVFEHDYWTKCPSGGLVYIETDAFTVEEFQTYNMFARHPQ